MANIINIVEENNILSFKQPPLDVVCGNTNYSLNFTFSEEWSSFENKIAVFVVNGVKTTVEFQGEECPVPAMPNASTCFVYVMVGDAEDRSLISTALKLRLIPTTDGSAEADFEGFKNYLSLALEKLKQFEQGNYVAKTAEESLTQVDLTTNQTISGEKDFVGKLSYNGTEVATKSAFSNKNIVYNGDFRINQRGKTSYTGKRDVILYCVDRWRICGVNSVFNHENKELKILKNHTFSQVIELEEALKGKTLTACLNSSAFTKNATLFFTDGVNEVTKTIEEGDNILTLCVDVNAENVEFGIRGASVNATGTLNYAKIEVGDSYTGYYYESYNQELLRCQEYYFRKISTGENGILGVGACPTGTETRIVVEFPTEMRITPTVTINGEFSIYSSAEEVPVSYSVYSFQNNSFTFNFETSYASAGMGAILIKKAEGTYIELDAEIY